MPEVLADPVDAEVVPGVLVPLTHRAWGFTYQPWNDPPLISYSVLGILDADGCFRAVAGHEDYRNISRERLNGIEGGITPDTIRALHQETDP